MSDLEKFLQQAAERMKERTRQQQPGPRPSDTSKQPIRQKERAAPQVDEPEILDAELVDAAPAPKAKSLPRKLQSNIEKRKSPVSTNVDMADERMAQHLEQVFQHSVGQLGQQPINPGSRSTLGTGDLTNRSSEVDRREHMSSPLIEVLRQPENLKAAFIVGEIFRPKF